MTVALRSRAGLALGALALAVLPARVHAGGFAVENQGARAMGFAGAAIAQTGDPSAIYWNAAGVAFLKGSQVYLSGGLGSIATDFRGAGPTPPAGTLEKTDRILTVLPSLYFTQQVSDDLVLGVGFYAPFEYRSRWQSPDSFTGRFLCVDCEVRSWSLNPTLAYRIEDRLAVGVGLDVRLARFSHQQRLLAEPNPFPVPTDVAELVIDGASDTGFGFNVGFLASPSEGWSIGLTYRHEVTAEYSGTARFNQVLTGDTVVDDAVRESLPPNQPVAVLHAFPASFGGGLAFRRGDWTVEGDVVWTFWSSFDAVTLTYPSEEGIDTTVLPQAYENTLQLRLGLEHLLGDAWAVRGGYSYDRSPQPADTLSPILHDGDRHGFSVGGGYRHENLRLDVFARYLLFASRSTGGLRRYAYDGVYETNAFQAGFALGYRF